VDSCWKHGGSGEGCPRWEPRWGASGQCGGTSAELSDSGGAGSRQLPGTTMPFAAWRKESSERKGEKKKREHLEVN